MTRTNLNILMMELDNKMKDILNLATVSIEALVPLLAGKVDDMLYNTINNYDRKIRILGDNLEKLIIKILSLQAPVGRDLRKVISSFRIIYDIERISRDALHVYKYFKNSIQLCDFQILSTLLNDVSITLDPLRRILNNFYTIYFNDNIIQSKANMLAKTSSAFDEQIDNLYEQKIKDIYVMSNNGNLTTEAAHNLLFALRSYERVGDHACNLLERAVYIQTGNKIEVK